MLRNYFLFVVLILVANISTQSQTQPPKFRVEFAGNKVFSSERLLKNSMPATTTMKTILRD